jgi:SSS family solute:Na+ symporter
MLLAASIAPVIADLPGLFHYLQSALAYLVPPVAVVFLLGLFWRGASATGAMTTLVAGHLASAALFTLSVLELWSLHFTLVAGLLTLLSLPIMLITSRFGQAPAAQQLARFTYHAGVLPGRPGARWWQDYRLYAVVLLVLTTIQVVAHR